MIVKIDEVLRQYGVQEGSVILYRDKEHKKKALCEYVASKLKNEIGTDPILICSVGAYAINLAKVLPNNKIILNGILSPEYEQQRAGLTNLENIGPQSLNRAYLLSQYQHPIFPEYYSKHLNEILLELGNIKIDAFCDFGHSFSTLAGFIESGLTDWIWLNGVFGVNEKRNYFHLEKHKGKFLNVQIGTFDTKELQELIEKLYPEFGNVFESTRSIAAAITWLKDNPCKTVLIYVGDDPKTKKE